MPIDVLHFRQAVDRESRSPQAVVYPGGEDYFRRMPNRRSLFLFFAWPITTLAIAWAANLPPDVPYETFGLEEDDFPYFWEYPAGVAISGALILLMLRPWRQAYSVAGSIVVFVLLVAAFVYLGATVMHQPSVHGFVFLLAFVSSQAALFYCGYAIASRHAERSQRRGNAKRPFGTDQ